MKLEDKVACAHTIRCLRAAGIADWEQLSGCTYDELLAIRGIGKVIASDLMAMIEAEGRDDSHGL